MMTRLPVSGKNYTLKLTLICFFFLALLFFVLRPSSSSSAIALFNAQQTLLKPTQQQQQQCGDGGLPPSVSDALVHYATSKITPQQTLKEISVTKRILRRKGPCNFLVFGLGYDSPMWAALNQGGRTVFLEEDSTWIKQIRAKFPDLVSHHFIYGTKLRHADNLLRSASGSPACSAVVDPKNSDCLLAMKKLPQEVSEVEWDVIMVDAPTGYHKEAPGRMTAIYTAGLMARNRVGGGETHVMVHDVDRPVEDRFSKAFLCQGYMKEQEGKLRHFVIPSHRADPGRSFCP